MPEPLTRVPTCIVQGTSVSWRWSSSDFDPGAGWALDYAIEGPTNLDVLATAEGDGFRVDLAPDATSPLVAGFYRWQAFASNAGPPEERVLVAAGALEVVADYAASAGTVQLKTHARRMLEALEAVLEGRATDGQLRMSINGRSIDRIPLPELMAARDRYRREVAAETAAEEQGARAGRRRRIKARF